MGQLEDILKHQNMVRNNIMKSFGAETSEDSLEKSFEDEVNPFEMEAYKSELTKAELDEFEKAKHQDGDMHPNGKWVWRQSANGGKGDWRVAKPGGSKATAGSTAATTSNKVHSSTSKQTVDENKKNTVTHDINGTKVTVTKNRDGSYTLEANGKKVKSDDPSFFVNGTNLKPRVKAALAKEVGLEMKKTSKKTARSIYGDNGYMSKEFLSYLEKNKDKIWPRTDWTSYTNITVHHYGSKDSNYVAITGNNEYGVRVRIDDAYITGEGTNAGSHQVSKNSAIEKIVEDYKKGK